MNKWDLESNCAPRCYSGTQMPYSVVTFYEVPLSALHVIVSGSAVSYNHSKAHWLQAGKPTIGRCMSTTALQRVMSVSIQQCVPWGVHPSVILFWFVLLTEPAPSHTFWDCCCLVFIYLLEAASFQSLIQQDSVIFSLTFSWNRILTNSCHPHSRTWGPDVLWPRIHLRHTAPVYKLPL